MLQLLVKFINATAGGSVNLIQCVLVEAKKMNSPFTPSLSKRSLSDPSSSNPSISKISKIIQLISKTLEKIPFPNIFAKMSVVIKIFVEFVGNILFFVPETVSDVRENVCENEKEKDTWRYSKMFEGNS
jgi:hypothetical protein